MAHMTTCLWKACGDEPTNNHHSTLQLYNISSSFSSFGFTDTGFIDGFTFTAVLQLQQTAMFKVFMWKHYPLSTKWQCSNLLDYKLKHLAAKETGFFGGGLVGTKTEIKGELIFDFSTNEWSFCSVSAGCVSSNHIQMVAFFLCFTLRMESAKVILLVQAASCTNTGYLIKCYHVSCWFIVKEEYQIIFQGSIQPLPSYHYSVIVM